MNIDIINKKVAKELSIKEENVILVNQFFWRKIYDHLYSYNPDSINIKNIGVLYPQKYLLKSYILKYIKKIKTVKNSKILLEGSALKNAYLTRAKLLLKQALNIRKANKYTN